MKKLFGYLTGLAGLAGAVAALALLIANVGTLHEAWCKNIGTFCSPPPESIDWAKSDASCQESNQPIPLGCRNWNT
jgi:hypothetical protein